MATLARHRTFFDLIEASYNNGPGVYNRRSLSGPGTGLLSSRSSVLGFAALLFLSFAWHESAAEIVFSGDFRTGDFSQWVGSGSDSVAFWLVPEYGRPRKYSSNQVHVGNGELMSLVARTERTRNIAGVGEVYYPAGPTRGASEYALRVTVKNSASGVEPQDCDPAGQLCDRRRANLQGEHIMPTYGTYQHRRTSWGSLSIYIPEDFSPQAGGWMTFTGVKPRGWGGSGIFGLDIQNAGTSEETWAVHHRWHLFKDGDGFAHDWRGHFTYTKSSPGRESADWKDTRDFPDEESSKQALAKVTRNGWTDWVWQIHMDERPESQGGVGFWNVWKRDGDGPWVHVLRIVPKITSRGGREFAHGIGYNLADYSGFPSIYSGSNTGLYAAKDVLWNAGANTTVYIANVKVGIANARFEDMSPDGSSPGADGRESSLPRQPDVKVE